MKRLICTLLCMVMILSLVACGGSTEESSATTEQTLPPETTAALDVLHSGEGFRVGYARVDITPKKSVPLGGFGNTSMRMSVNVLRRLYATCIAIADEQDNLILLYALDLQGSQNLLTSRDVVAMQMGIPSYHIVYNSSHTHAGPDVTNTKEPNLAEWLDTTNVQLVEVAQEAVADLKPATLSYGSVETYHMNFIKHYQHTLPDGTVKYFGDNFGEAVYDSTTKHITEIDPTMHVIEFQREGGKPVVMTNWRAHPLMDGSSSKFNVSADFIGAFRESLELKYDCHFAFFQGAAGNNNSKTRLSEESRTSDTAEYGNILADYALEALQNMTPVEDPGLIQTRNTMFEGRCNHDTDSLYYRAIEVQSIWTATNDHAQVKAAGAPYGIRSAYHANAIVARYNRPETYTTELNAIAIGDCIGFVTAPNELFDTLSVMTEEGSPYPMTMTLGYSNGYTGYIPSARGWEYTSYESDVSWYAPGTGEEFVECFLDMLGDMATAEE